MSQAKWTLLWSEIWNNLLFESIANRLILNWLFRLTTILSIVWIAWLHPSGKTLPVLWGTQIGTMNILYWLLVCQRWKYQYLSTNHVNSHLSTFLIVKRIIILYMFRYMWHYSWTKSVVIHSSNHIFFALLNVYIFKNVNIDDFS